MIEDMCLSNPENWDEEISRLLFHFCTSKSQNGIASPFSIMFARNPTGQFGGACLLDCLGGGEFKCFQAGTFKCGDILERVRPSISLSLTFGRNCLRTSTRFSLKVFLDNCLFVPLCLYFACLGACSVPVPLLYKMNILYSIALVT